jgi:putative thiamine transport system permease protein
VDTPLRHEVTHPRSACSAPSRGGSAGGPAKPDPRRSLGKLRAALVLPLAVFALPLALALALALWQGADPDAWRALLADPQLPRALSLSVGTACVSTVLALAACLALVTQLYGTPLWQRLSRTLAPMLALPHAAFAIGLALLLAPAGLLARLLAPLMGWATPPDWPTVNDPQGLGLTLVLVGKELPFLLWHAVALLQRPDVAAQLKGWLASGATLGYSRSALWWRVLWQQLLPRLGWPLLAVLAYALTVVDLALIVGPSSPPTLALIAWQGLLAGDPARHAEAAAAALLLAAVLLVLTLAALAAYRAGARLWQYLALDGQRAPHRPRADAAARALWGGLLGLYALVALLLLASSCVGVWTFPALLPQTWAADAWSLVRASGEVLGLSAGLAAFAALAALALVLCWFEATPTAWDARVMPLVLAPLVVPALLLMAGLYTLALHLTLDGTLAGLAWVHTLVTLPYVFVALAPAWRSFDPRYEWAALALGRSRWAFWWRVKLPLLAAPLAAALAVGFAVSVAQYLPTQFIGAGRLATVTTEAVTLASGGQRHTAAAFAVLQALLPAIGFALAAWVGRWQRARIQK